MSGFTKYGCDDLAENHSLKEEGSPEICKVSVAGYFEQREEQAGIKVRAKTWTRNKFLRLKKDYLLVKVGLVGERKGAGILSKSLL